MEANDSIRSSNIGLETVDISETKISVQSTPAELHGHLLLCWQVDLH